jgi:hypothetical protein
MLALQWPVNAMKCKCATILMRSFGDLEVLIFAVPGWCLCWQVQRDDRTTERLLLEVVARLGAEELFLHRRLEGLAPPGEHYHNIAGDTHKPGYTRAVGCTPCLRLRATY